MRLVTVKYFIVSLSAKIFEKVKQNYDLKYGVRLRLHSVLLKARIGAELRNADSYGKEENTEGLLFSFAGKRIKKQETYTEV